MPFTAADANRVAFKYLKEVTFGTTPASPLKLMRYNSHNIGMKPTFVSSNEIRSDRQRSDTILTSKTSDGDVNLEWSYGAPDDLIEGALQSTWSAPTTIGPITTVSITSATANSCIITNSVASFPAFPVGAWVSVAGFAGVNGPRFFAKVVSNSTTVLTLTQPSLSTLAVVGAGATVTIQQQGYIRNGTTPTSFTLESEFADIANTFFNHKGMRVSTMNLNVGSSQIVTGSFGFMGLGTATATATVTASATATNTAPA